MSLPPRRYLRAHFAPLSRRTHRASMVRLAALFVAPLLPILGVGCGPTTTSTDGDGLTTIILVAPEDVTSNGIMLDPGETVRIQWSPTDVTTAAVLVVRDTTTQATDKLSEDVTTGSLDWTVPTDLPTDTAFQILIVATGTGDTILASAPFRVTGSGDVDTCTNGACDEPADDLVGLATDAVTGEPIDFSAALIVGRHILLTAPDITAGTSDDIAVGTATDASSNALAAAQAPTSCACAWRLDTRSAGTFDDDEVCTTGLTMTEPGDFTIYVEVICSGERESFGQAITVTYQPCETDEDCAEDEVCNSSGYCEAAPPAPKVTLLTEEFAIPYVVRLDLRLEDADGEVIPDGVTRDQFHIFENNEPIDLTETNQFVTALPDLPLRIVLVLDYSQSMAQAEAIGTMVSAATKFVQADYITATHQIGIVAFHDRTEEGAGYNKTIDLTGADADGKDAIVSAIPAEGSLEAGLSRVWDAVELAVGMIGTIEPQTGEVRTVVFLTDGRDTSSDADPDAIAELAIANGVKLYPIGFGDVAENEAVLRSLAEQTGGAYFTATDTDELASTFEQVALELRGEWNLTYITPTNSGTVNARVEFEWEGLSTSFETSFEAGQLDGDVYQGVIEVTDRCYDAALNQTCFSLVARYLPRNVNRFRFRFAHSAAIFGLQETGGLTEPADGWTLIDEDDAVYDVIGPGPLEFGAFGPIGTVRVPGDVELLQVTHEDFTTDVQPKTIIFDGLWALPYTVDVTIQPTDTGYVIISPNKDGYGDGEIVTLQAFDASGTFESWSGDTEGDTPVTILTVDSDKSVTATFTTGN